MPQVVQNLTTDRMTRCFQSMSKSAAEIDVITPSVWRTKKQNSDCTFEDVLRVNLGRITRSP
jgi:hypothetical protein